MPTLDLNIVKRLEKGSPLTAQEMDDNLCQFYDAWQALIDLVTSVIGVDGKLANCSVATDSLCDRIVTQAKRAWGSDFVADDTGVADAVAISFTPSITAYSTKVLVAAKIKATNTGAATLNIDGVGATAIKKHGTEVLEAGDLVAGKVSLFAYDGTNFQLLNPTRFNVAVTAPTSTQMVPVTDPYVIDFAAGTAITAAVDGDVKSAGTPGTHAWTHDLTYTSPDYDTAYERSAHFGQKASGTVKQYHSYADIQIDLTILQSMLASIASMGEVSAIVVNTYLRLWNGTGGAVGGGLFYKNPSAIYVPSDFRDADGIGALAGAGTHIIPVSGSTIDLRVMLNDTAQMTVGLANRKMDVHAEITHVLLRQ